MAKVTGIGGIFIKFKDPKKMNLWYKEVLDLTVNDYGVLFGFNHTADKRAFMQLGTFDENTKYFGKDTQQVMLNFRVSGMEELVKNLASKAVKFVDEIETYDYGKFIHIEDPEGNRIELWEPVENGFETSEPYHDME